MDWMTKANCKGQTNLFFAPAGEREAARNRRVAQATALCAACPVLAECTGYAAISNEGAAEEYGIWGGQARKA
jgi:WhiB family redox-sensing transcriptional regulator